MLRTRLSVRPSSRLAAWVGTAVAAVALAAPARAQVPIWGEVGPVNTTNGQNFGASTSIGGPKAGVYRSTTAGVTWTAINGTGQTQLGNFTNAVVARGNLIVTSSETLGVCQSTNGGASYTRIVGGATGFPLQSSYALAGDT